MRNKYEGGDLLVEALKQNGVREIFSLSGGPINSIYNAASNNDLPLIHVRHEQAAGYMADAVAKVTGTPSVAAVTLGPATSNMVTNALMTKMAGTPMFIIGGQGKVADLNRDAEMATDGWDKRLKIEYRNGRFSSVSETVDESHDTEQKYPKVTELCLKYAFNVLATVLQVLGHTFLSGNGEVGFALL